MNYFCIYIFIKAVGTGHNKHSFFSCKNITGPIFSPKKY